MPYDKHIDQTEEALQDLRAVYKKNDIDRFLDGLESGRNRREEDVIEFTNFIRKSDGLTQLEYVRLKRLVEEGFIEKFATNCNKRFSTCNMLMNKMRSTISRGVEMLERFCEKKRSRGHSKSNYKVIDSSKMGRGPYMNSLCGLEFCIDSVRVLYNEVEAYKVHLTECIDLTLNICKQVAYIRNHPKEAHEKHLKNRLNVLQNSRSVIRRFIDMNADMENDLMKRVEVWQKEQKSLEEISAMLYHTLDENEYNDWIISEEVMAARREGITNQERALWGDNKQQVLRCRVAYSHIDELNPEGQEGHIGGKFIALLYKWSSVSSSRGLDYWLTYFIDFYQTSGGVLTPVKIGAVKRCLTQIVKEEIEKKEVENFNKRMDSLVEKYMIKSNNQVVQMKKAANF